MMWIKFDRTHNYDFRNDIWVLKKIYKTEIQLQSIYLQDLKVNNSLCISIVYFTN